MPTKVRERVDSSPFNFVLGILVYVCTQPSTLDCESIITKIRDNQLEEGESPSSYLISTLNYLFWLNYSVTMATRTETETTWLRIRAPVN